MITKTQIIKKHSIIAKQFHKVQMEKEVALSDNECLTRKVSKPKEIVEELLTRSKDTHEEVRSSKSVIIKAEQDYTSSTNTFLSKD
jgi:hypothetical protein